MLDKTCQRFGAGIEMSTGEIVHRGLRYELIVHRGLRYELMPVSMLISTAVPYCLLLEGVELLIFTTDKAYGRAAVSQGGVGKRWKNHGVFLRYSYSSDLILPLLASDTPVLALDVLRA